MMIRPIIVNTLWLDGGIHVLIFSVCVNCDQTEKATDVSQASEDWALYMEICDVINSTEDGYVTCYILMYEKAIFFMKNKTSTNANSQKI